MELRILIRQQQVFNINGQPIYYSGTSPYNLKASTGTLPLLRQWQNYPNFIDITDQVSDLYKLKLSWSIQRTSQGAVNPGSNEVQKGVSGTLNFEGLAYDLLKSWLTEDVSAPLNSVEVKILDSECGYYEGYVIRPSELQWCEGDICSFALTVKQQDEPLNCIKRTMIFDNWQGWFEKVPLNGKKHPRFSYCVEQRPAGILIALWFIMATFLTPIAFILTIILILIIIPIVSFINVIVSVINSLGGSLSPIKVPSITAIFDALTAYFVETVGCGREHPAPLIRDYITNVCDRCGIKVDAVTAPVFFAPKINIDTNSQGLVNKVNPHYMACYFFPQVKRGIRRFNTIDIFGNQVNTNEFWVDENRPLLTLDLFLDELKTIYNAEWRIKNGSLYFQRKDYYLNSNYIYDFTGADRLKILEGICFEPNELKYAASCKGLYMTDAADMNEAGGFSGTGQMNGLISFGNTDDNPNFEGILDKTVQFGATKFNLDGASECYYFNALQQTANISSFAAIFTLVPFLNILTIGQVTAALHDWGDYALLMQGETCSLPKILIWNGETYLNAKCVGDKGAWSGQALPMPNINLNYGSDPWNVARSVDNHVMGSGIVFGGDPPGQYYAAALFGLIPLADRPATLVNYPMYFAPEFEDSMWDWFHWIDDPKANPVMNFNWRVKIDNCCDDLKKLGVLNDAGGIVLGDKVKLPFGYYQDGVIREIDVSYDPSDEYGKWIELKGTL